MMPITGHSRTQIPTIGGKTGVGRTCAHPRSSEPRRKSSPSRCFLGIQGFTLLEILVAITILGIILATLLGLFTGIVSTSESASKKAELYQTGRALMDLLCADIRGFYPLSTLEGKTFFLGFSGTSQDDQELTRMDFTTTHTLSIGAERNPFLSEVGYKVKRNGSDPLFTLWRRAEYPPASPFDEGGREVPVCRIVESFRLEFVINDDTNLDLIEGKVPEAVVLSFTLNLEGEREQFVTMVRPIVKF
jgi:prepilin-type N-terminal cleavage/methylation domain-containing protein